MCKLNHIAAVYVKSLNISRAVIEKVGIFFFFEDVSCTEESLGSSDCKNKSWVKKI